uniref:Uncharacterized protein n=1 Tax=Oryza brachyantha TaxID=4533 RepID=J3MN22_ORYBR
MRGRRKGLTTWEDLDPSPEEVTRRGATDDGVSLRSLLVVGGGEAAASVAVACVRLVVSARPTTRGGLYTNRPLERGEIANGGGPGQRSVRLTCGAQLCRAHVSVRACRHRTLIRAAPQLGPFDRTAPGQFGWNRPLTGGTMSFCRKWVPMSVSTGSSA